MARPACWRRSTRGRRAGARERYGARGRLRARAELAARSAGSLGGARRQEAEDAVELRRAYADGRLSPTRPGAGDRRGERATAPARPTDLVRRSAGLGGWPSLRGSPAGTTALARYAWGHGSRAERLRERRCRARRPL